MRAYKHRPLGMNHSWKPYLKIIPSPLISRTPFYVVPCVISSPSILSPAPCTCSYLILHKLLPQISKPHPSYHRSHAVLHNGYPARLGYSVRGSSSAKRLRHPGINGVGQVSTGGQSSSKCLLIKRFSGILMEFSYMNFKWIIREITDLKTYP